MNYLKTYSDFLKKHIALKKSLRVVFDASNGATGAVLKETFSNVTNLEAHVINNNPDPNFSAHGPNPLAEGATDQLGAKVRELKANIGIIFDADGDRAMVVDETGKRIESYVLLLLLFKSAQPPFVVDELTYQSLKRSPEIKVNDVIASQVGASHIKDKMREHKASVGGEYSGHYYFDDFFYTDSGILAGIKVLNALSRETKTLSEMTAHAQKILAQNIQIEFGAWEHTQARVEKLFRDQGAEIEKRDGITAGWSNRWINIRTSNTEPLLRITAGGFSQQELETAVKDIQSLL